MAASGETLLELKNIDAGYGKLQVLYDISLAIPPKSTTIIVGRNGAGKTTLLKTIAGFIKPYRGRVIFDGMDITGIPPYKRARLGIVYLRQDKRIFDNLTVNTCLKLVAYVFKKSPDDIEKVLDLFPRLRERLNSKARFLSGGERQMLLLAQGLLASPKLLLIDEPTEGLSPAVVQLLTETLLQIKEEGKISMVLAEQNIDVAKTLADQIVVLSEGKILDKVTERTQIQDLNLSRYKI